MVTAQDYDNAIDWDAYFYSIAETVAEKSLDESSKVGAVAVTFDRLVVSTGFNGIARGLPDDPEVLEHKEEKLKWICHAEMNAIFNAVRSGTSLFGATIYVNKFPCLACCNGMIQAGLRGFYTLDSTYWKNDPFDDKQGTRKQQLLSLGVLDVNAPNHDQYKKTLVTSAAQPPAKASSH